MITKVLLKIQNAHYKNNHQKKTVQLWLHSYQGRKLTSNVTIRQDHNNTAAKKENTSLGRVNGELNSNL